MLLLFIILVALCNSRPNIIFILSDDLGYYDIGYQNNNQIHTPNINKYISEGQFLQYYYGQPACSPTRGSILTSKYPLHHGLQTWIHGGLPIAIPLEDNIFLSQQLLNNGYDTHMVGKWHLGEYKWEFCPTFRGFTTFYGYYGGGEDYYKHIAGGYYDFRDDIGLNCGLNCSRVASEAYGNYSAYLFTQRAIDIIGNHSINNDDNKPLFLYLAYQSVHSPAQVPQQYIKPYNNSITNKKRRTYAGMLSVMDEGIGNITSALSKYGYLDNNTIIIFSSDNGGLIDIPQYNVKGIGGNNYPLRGGKQSLWEGGVRITGFIWGTTDIIPSRLHGTKYTQLLHATDWYPTIMSACNITYTLNYSIDGIDHWNGISGMDNNSNDRYFAYRNNIYFGNETLSGNTSSVSGNGNNTSYRSKWYKIYNSFGGYPNDWGAKPTDYVNYNSNTNCMLFNISNDSTEHDDIASENENVVTQLLNTMNDITITAIPLPIDNSCASGKNIVHPIDPVLGIGVWIPWC